MTAKRLPKAQTTVLALALKKTCPTEFVEQSFLMQWASRSEVRYPALKNLFAVPNGGYLLSKAAAGKLKAAGLKKGYPDLALDAARRGYHGLRIEMKRMFGGHVEDEQTDWHNRLRDAGYCVVVCKGWETARDTIVWYLDDTATGRV